MFDENKFLSATQLEITEAERDGLVAFWKAAPALQLFVGSTDEVTRYGADHYSIPKPTRFNMELVLEVPSNPLHTCGSVCCIGGYVGWTIFPDNPDEATSYVLSGRVSAYGVPNPNGHSKALRELYFPDPIYVDGERRTDASILPLEAANVVARFLLTGRVDWTRMQERANAA